MATTSVREVTHGPGFIKWSPHVCPSPSTANILSTPASMILSNGLGALSAGIGIANAIQLNAISNKLDYVQRGIDQVVSLTKQVRESLQDVQDLQYLKTVFDGSRENFEQKLKLGQIDIAAVQSFEGDVETTLRQFVFDGDKLRDIKRVSKDAPIPNWMVDKAEPTFSFFRLLNFYLVESHNRLLDYDPWKVRRYSPIDAVPDYFVEDRANSEFTKIVDELKMIQKVHNDAAQKLPRLRWLTAFTWEIKMTRFNLATSSALASGTTNTLMLPALDIVDQKQTQKSTLSV